jgi:exopolysaccharide biosynthesis protein
MDTGPIRSLLIVLPLLGLATCSKSGPLVGPGPANYSNSNSWYNLINARTAIGLTQDKRTLVLFTVDVRPTSGADRSQGMRVGEVADVLLQYGVWNALNLDGGGSTSMAMQGPGRRCPQGHQRLE